MPDTQVIRQCSKSALEKPWLQKVPDHVVPFYQDRTHREWRGLAITCVLCVALVPHDDYFILINPTLKNNGIPEARYNNIWCHIITRNTNILMIHNFMRIAKFLANLLNWLWICPVTWRNPTSIGSSAISQREPRPRRILENVWGLHFTPKLVPVRH